LPGTNTLDYYKITAVKGLITFAPDCYVARSPTSSTRGPEGSPLRPTGSPTPRGWSWGGECLPVRKEKSRPRFSGRPRRPRHEGFGSLWRNTTSLGSTVLCSLDKNLSNFKLARFVKMTKQLGSTGWHQYWLLWTSFLARDKQKLIGLNATTFFARAGGEPRIIFGVILVAYSPLPTKLQ
jgi:hypothetical protein